MATKLMNLKKIAETLDEHPATTRSRLRRGEIRGLKKGDGPRAQWYATESAVSHFITKRTR